jgi:uncharacterized membrane protein
MSIAFAPSPWPAPASGTAAGASPAWRFGAVVRLAGRTDGRGPQDQELPAEGRAALRWVLKRNCSITPRQLLAFYLSLCVISVGLGVGFWVAGAPLVLGFAGLELACVGLALLVYARHAADREMVTLDGDALEVEQWVGRQVARERFRAEWLSVEPAKAQGSLVELAGQGRRVRVGRHLRPELRAPFAQELRRALRRAQAGLPPEPAPEDCELELQR